MAKLKSSVVVCTIPPDFKPSGKVAANDSIWHTREHVDAVAKTATGKGISICIGDTGGTDASQYLPEPAGAIDYTGSRHGWRDVQGHGAHCAGSSLGNSGLSFSPDAAYYIAKGLGDSGSGSDEALAKGIVWAADQGCHIYSGSWGSSSRSQRVADAIKYFYANGGLICNIAAGNSGFRRGANTVGWPARLEGDDSPFSIAALRGSSWSNLERADFSSVGPQNDAAAPGQNIRSVKTGTRSSLTDMSGTSMATPVKTSIDACVLEVMIGHGYGIPKTVEDWFSFYAKIPNAIIDLGSQGTDDFHGAGALNTLAIIEWLAEGSEHSWI